MHGRYFAGQKIEASLSDGDADQTQEDDEEAEENERLADFGKWLMVEESN